MTKKQLETKLAAAERKLNLMNRVIESALWTCDAYSNDTKEIKPDDVIFVTAKELNAAVEENDPNIMALFQLILEMEALSKRTDEIGGRISDLEKTCEEHTTVISRTVPTLKERIATLERDLVASNRRANANFAESGRADQLSAQLEVLRSQHSKTVSDLTLYKDERGSLLWTLLTAQTTLKGLMEWHREHTSFPESVLIRVAIEQSMKSIAHAIGQKPEAPRTEVVPDGEEV